MGLTFVRAHYTVTLIQDVGMERAIFPFPIVVQPLAVFTQKEISKKYRILLPFHWECPEIPPPSTHLYNA